MSLYYIIASLPSLQFGDPPPFSAEELLDQGTGVLPEADLRELEAVVRDEMDRTHSSFAQAWRQADTQLRNAVAVARADRLRDDAGPYLQPHTGFDVSIEKAVTDAFAKPGPLERELTLDRCRWRILDDLSRKDPFSLGALLAYALRLRIAHRWVECEEAAGTTRLAHLLDAYISDSGLTVQTAAG